MIRGHLAPGILGVFGQRLVDTGQLRPPSALTRAQINTSVTALGADGVTWASFAANVPRFTGTGQRLLIGGQRTNSVRNPRGESATVGTIGSGGAMPTNYSLNAGGLAVDIVATGTTNGVSWVRYRAHGTSTSTALIITFDTTFAIPASASQTWSGSWFYRLVDAPLPPLSHFTRISSRDSGGAALANGSVAFTPTATFQRFDRAQALSSSGSTAYVTFAYSTSNTTGAAYDWTFEIGWPQIELGAFASTPILPSIGTPAASTRGADSLAIGLRNFLPSATGTLLMSGVAPVLSGSHTLLQLHAGSDANRFLVVASGTALSLQRSLAGASASVAAGNLVAGQVFRLALSVNAAGRAAMSLNGAAAVAVTGGPTSGLATILLGSQLGGAAALHGEVSHLSTLPHVAADAALPGLANGIP